MSYDDIIDFVQIFDPDFGDEIETETDVPRGAYHLSQEEEHYNDPDWYSSHGISIEGFNTLPCTFHVPLVSSTSVPAQPSFQLVYVPISAYVPYNPPQAVWNPENFNYSLNSLHWEDYETEEDYDKAVFQFIYGAEAEADSDDTPTQKISWNVEKNTVDFDLDAMCLCGYIACEYKFGANKLHNLDSLYLEKESDSDYEKARKEKMRKDRAELQENFNRELIQKLESQSKTYTLELKEKKSKGNLTTTNSTLDPSNPSQKTPAEKPTRSLPLTLWSGVPFQKMTTEQLLKSQEELKDILHNEEGRLTIERQIFYNATRNSDSLTKTFMGKFVDEIYQRINHVDIMLSDVMGLLRTRTHSHSF